MPRSLRDVFARLNNRSAHRANQQGNAAANNAAPVFVRQPRTQVQHGGGASTRPRPTLPVNPLDRYRAAVPNASPADHLHTAINLANLEYAERVLDEGADPNAINPLNSDGNTAFMVVMNDPRPQNDMILTAMLRTPRDGRIKVDPGLRNRRGDTVFHVAANTQHADRLRTLLHSMLLELGGFTRANLRAALDARDSNGRTPERRAIETGNHRTAEVFAEFRERLARERQ